MTGYYCFDHCRYERLRIMGQLVFIGPCVKTGKEQRVTVKEIDLDKWMEGMHIQNAFPYLKAWEREFLLNGYSEEGWKLLFTEEEEEDDEPDPYDLKLGKEREEGSEPSQG